MDKVKNTWLFSELATSLRSSSDHVARIGTLALFGALVPSAQQWVNGIIRQYVEKYDINIILKALVRCKEYYTLPDQRYWHYAIDAVNGEVVEECSPFTPGSYPADDRECAELLLVTKSFER